MKKIFSLFAILFCVELNAQIVDTVNIGTHPEIKYIEVVGFTKFLNPNKVNIVVDYGQEKRIFDDVISLRDKTGKKVVFNGMVDALNFFELNGWTYVSNYIVTLQNSNVYHFLLRKKQ